METKSIDMDDEVREELFTTSAIKYPDILKSIFEGIIPLLPDDDDENTFKVNELV